jgi:hypothetical protein
MTISLRNTFVRIGLAVCAALFIAFTAGIVFGGKAFQSNVPSLAGRSEIPSFLWNAKPNLGVFALASGFPIAFSLAATALFLRYFKKTASPESFLFAVFALSVSLEAFRTLQFLALGPDGSMIYRVSVTRMVFFSRFFGVLNLFAASLYSVGINYQSYERVLLIEFLIAFSVAMLIPVNGDAIEPGMICSLGYGSMLKTIYYAIAAFAFLDLVVASGMKGSKEYAAAGIGILAIVLGREVLSAVPSLPWVLVGIAVMGGGGYLFLSRMHKLYLWL